MNRPVRDSRLAVPGLAFVTLAMFSTLACSSAGSGNGGGSGGDGSGGVGSGSGGNVGNVGSGGTTSSGGAVDSGGTSGSGGKTGSGGASSGGTSASGGAHSGGSVGTGGASSGGTVGTGGRAAGGTTSAGGTTGAGGHAGLLRIMPLGDSTTASVCYRAVLWDLLNKAGHTGAFDFVGSNKSNSDTKGATCTPANADPDNEGHPSCLITEVIDNVDSMASRGCNTTLNALKPALQTDKADLVLMHFATNDVWNSIATSKITDAYGTMLDNLRATNPNIIVLVAQIIPMNVTATTCSGCSCPNCPANIQALNNALVTWAAAKTTTASPIVVVDQFTGFDATADTADGVHPNASGSMKIATKWAAALAPYF